eukprot:4110673-Alexandrium_andersonii.AAC.1
MDAQACRCTGAWLHKIFKDTQGNRDPEDGTDAQDRTDEHGTHAQTPRRHRHACARKHTCACVPLHRRTGIGTCACTGVHTCMRAQRHACAAGLREARVRADGRHGPFSNLSPG